MYIVVWFSEAFKPTIVYCNLDKRSKTAFFISLIFYTRFSQPAVLSSIPTIDVSRNRLRLNINFILSPRGIQTGRLDNVF